MAARSISTASISFGLVSIPVGIYTATAQQRISFHMLHKACGSRVTTRMVCPVHDVTVEAHDIVRGYEHTKGMYVTFSEEELKSLETERTSLIELVEFVPASTIDLLYIEDTHYLGPEKNGAKAYQLLARALKRTDRVAIGLYGTRGKTNLVAIRPYERGLILHALFYADEVRSFDAAVSPATTEPAQGVEIAAATKLMNAMSTDRFDAAKYTDNWRAQVRRAVDEKVAGLEVSVEPAAAPKGQIIDLLEALKRSVAAAGGAANESKTPPARASEPPPSLRPGPKKATARAAKTTKKRASKTR